MKRIIRFFVVCLALSAFQTGVVFGADNVRGGQKRDVSKTVSTSNSRSISTTQKHETKKSDVTRTTAKNVKSANTVQKDKKSVVPRSENTKTTVKQRDGATPTKTASRTRSANVVSRSAKNVQNPTKVSGRNSTLSRASQRNLSRAAEIDTEKMANIKSRDYSKCKTVYYECMDEFCANKDANLRRCACSTRVHEFDNIKKQLAAAEDKMLDFNQRLLIVNLDKEDAAAINVASEGELAFAQKDSSESEKLLKKITDALNTSGDSKTNNNLSSLSLNMDSAWDSVDSLSGIETTSKNGIDLYNAATPVCLEMAREVCSEEELDIAQSGYKLTIQQDCNTVAKAYNSQYNNAMNKIHESSALLDMARLNNYQQRNSDDTLTCKKKILEQLSNESVCGTNLYKCLDTTGQYINPSTGEAFLSETLYELSNLLTVPENDETWSKIDKNDKFVSFLNSKKKFLEPAMQQCEDMADTIWKEFLDDALAQIKLAQNSKLEEIRQSCTTLVTECKTSALESLTDFDSRALSTFSVIADTTANAFCTNVEKSCTALLNNSGEIDNTWQSGIASVAADISYEKIIESCTTVGQNCIIKQCNGASGNFALCEESSSNPRRAILNREACWDEVLNCVKQSANIDSIKSGILAYRSNINAFYTNIYDTVKPYRVCDGNDASCLLTEQIWGNCEYNPKTSVTTTGNKTDAIKPSNMILMPQNNATNLLSWFATQTGTDKDTFSCNASGCPVNYKSTNDGCSLIISEITNDGNTVETESELLIVSENAACPVDNKTIIKNKCASATYDYWGNCCENGAKYDAQHGNKTFPVCVPQGHKAIPMQIAKCAVEQTDNTDTENLYYYCPDQRELTMYCITSGSETLKQGVNGFECDDGFWIIIDNYGNYFEPYPSYQNQQKVTMSYSLSESNKCVYTVSDKIWGWPASCKCENDDSIIPDFPTTENFIVTYNQ